MNPIWLLVVILLIVALVGAPTWPWPPVQHSYGWGPSGAVGTIVLVLIILLLLGRL